MNNTVITYIVYLVIAVPLTIWVSFLILTAFSKLLARS